MYCRLAMGLPPRRRSTGGGVTTITVLDSDGSPVSVSLTGLDSEGNEVTISNTGLDSEGNEVTVI